MALFPFLTLFVLRAYNDGYVEAPEWQGSPAVKLSAEELQQLAVALKTIVEGFKI